MKTMVALIRREFLEHRGAFLYAPAMLLVLFALIMASALGFNRWRPELDVASPTALKFFELAFLAAGALWATYLMFALFFYFADAFNADRRGNSMLFWKSMPVSDFTILGSKMLAGLTIFPLVIFGVILATGIVLYAFSTIAAITLPGLAVPNLFEVVGSATQIGVFALVFVALALLWYAPFFAWVGALSTVVGRWSIPLAFLLPGLAVLAENLIFRGAARIIGDFLLPGDARRGGYVLSFLKERTEFGGGSDSDLLEDRFRDWFGSGEPFAALPFVQDLLADIDWTQMGAGLIFTVVLVYLASEYRRRVIIA